MIITDPEVLKYIDEFEEIEKKNPQKSLELSPDNQQKIYTITKMFSSDKIFQLYISSITDDYARKITTLKKEEFQEALTDTLLFINSLNKEEEA